MAKTMVDLCFYPTSSLTVKYRPEMTFLKNLMKGDEENHLSMDIIWDFRQSCRANFAILSSQNFVGVSALSM